MSNEIGPLKLSGEQFWMNPAAHIGDIEMDRIRKRIDGMIIDVPPIVHLDVHPSIPIICHRSGESRKLHRFSLNSTTQIVVSHLETGKVRMVKLGETPDRIGSEPSPGWTTEFLDVDLLEIANLGPKLGKYAVWLICGPESSNQRTVEIYPTQLGKESKAVHEQIKILRNSSDVSLDKDIAQSNSVSDHGKNSLTPDFRGIVMHLDDKSETPHRLRIQFRIESLPMFQAVNHSDKRINAYLPISVFGFDMDRQIFLTTSLKIPVYQAIRMDNGIPILEGNVSLVLPELIKAYNQKMPLDLWAVSMSHLVHLNWKPNW